MNFEKDILIDESALEVEWINQPALAMQYGVHWAECCRTLDKAIENVKVVRSGLIDKITNDPEEYLEPGQKPTGPIIEAFYRNAKEHQVAKEEEMEAQHALRIAEIAHKEISTTRKAALTNLVTLHGQMYFAGPSVPRNIEREVTKRKVHTEANQKVGKRLKRRKDSHE